MDKAEKFYDTEYGKCWRACAAVAFSHQVFEHMKSVGNSPSQEEYEAIYEEAAYIASEFAERAAPAIERGTSIRSVPPMVDIKVPT